MKFSAEQIAGILTGSIEGNPSVAVSDLAKIDEGYEGSLSFLANPKFHPSPHSSTAVV
jgi:UDP-3-O-[3-hydroxymyristoyl] glucosamine N-acyltransferase